MVTTSLVPWVILQLLVRLTDTGSIGGIEAGKKGMSGILKDLNILSLRCAHGIHVGRFIHK